jgi:hypothetical protein
MNDNILELRDLLSSMKEILDNLLVIENEKTSVLEKGSVEQLDEIINSEQALIMECSTSEKERIRICSELKTESITELFEKYPESSALIKPVHEGMVDTINKIKKVSGINMQLLDTRLKLVKFITSQIGFNNENTTYDKNAQLT